MATLTDLQGQLDKLRKARGSGVLRVTDGNGRTVEYKSTADLQLAINAVASEIVALNKANGAVQPARQMRSFASKGTGFGC